MVSHWKQQCESAIHPQGCVRCESQVPGDAPEGDTVVKHDRKVTDNNSVSSAVEHMTCTREVMGSIPTGVSLTFQPKIDTVLPPSNHPKISTVPNSYGMVSHWKQQCESAIHLQGYVRCESQVPGDVAEGDTVVKHVRKVTDNNSVSLVVKHTTCTREVMGSIPTGVSLTFQLKIDTVLPPSNHPQD